MAWGCPCGPSSSFSFCSVGKERSKVGGGSKNGNNEYFLCWEQAGKDSPTSVSEDESQGELRKAALRDFVMETRPDVPECDQPRRGLGLK